MSLRQWRYRVSWRMSIIVIGCHYHVNEFVFHFITDKIKGSVKFSAVLLSLKTYV